jgi:cytochrome c556
MRIWSGAVILVLGLGVGTATTAAGKAGAQAAAEVSVAQHEMTMKSIAQANQAMQKAIKSNALADAGKQAKELATLFGTVERFWKQHNKADAVKLVQTAATVANEVAGAAAAGDQMKALMAAGNIGANCKQCHGTYREGDQETGFNIKPGTITQ